MWCKQLPFLSSTSMKCLHGDIKLTRALLASGYNHDDLRRCSKGASWYG
jgi:hypothetical protein